MKRRISSNVLVNAMQPKNYIQFSSHRKICLDKMVHFLFPLITYSFLSYMCVVLLQLLNFFSILFNRHLWKMLGLQRTSPSAICPLLKSKSFKEPSDIHPPIHLEILHIISLTSGQPPSEHFHLRGSLLLYKATCSRTRKI